MPGPSRMNMDSGARLGETPGRSRVIKMDVAKEDLPDVGRREAAFAHSLADMAKSGIGAGIEEGDPIVRLECGGGDNSAPVQMKRIENVDHSEMARDEL